MKGTLIADMNTIVDYVTEMCLTHAITVRNLQTSLRNKLDDEAKDSVKILDIPNKDVLADLIRRQLLNRSHLVDDKGVPNLKGANFLKIVTDIGLDVVLTTLHNGIGYDKFLISELPPTIGFINKVNSSEYTPGIYRKSAVKRLKRLPNV